MKTKHDMCRSQTAAWARWGWGVLWMFLATGLGSSELSAASRPPNVLLIISDDQAWTDYGFMGHPRIRTPHLDRLAAQSLLFPRGYVPSSLCCPSLASILTGRYPHQHGVVCNDPPRPPGMTGAAFYQSAAFREGRAELSAMIERTPTLPRLLAAKGYVSFQSGKWWQQHFSKGGFTHGMTAGDENHGGRHGDEGLTIGRKTLTPVTSFMEMAAREGKPWCVWYAPLLPHDPHTPPERLLAKYQASAPSLAVARYWAMVEWFDETCGQLLGFLEERGWATNTVVVYVADNGWITDPQSGRYAPKSKQSPYDGGVRTPIMVRWPGRIAPRNDGHAVSSVDLVPTLLRLVGADVPKDLPGLDLTDRRGVRGRSSIFGACFTHDAVDLSRPSSGLRWRWLVAGEWKLIVPNAAWQPGEGAELYRIQRDPMETQNLASMHPRTVERLRRRLDSWWHP